MPPARSIYRRHACVACDGEASFSLAWQELGVDACVVEYAELQTHVHPSPVLTACTNGSARCCAWPLGNGNKGDKHATFVRLAGFARQKSEPSRICPTPLYVVPTRTWIYPWFFFFCGVYIHGSEGPLALSQRYHRTRSSAVTYNSTHSVRIY